MPAYETLSNDNSRAQYDHTLKYGTPDTHHHNSRTPHTHTRNKRYTFTQNGRTYVFEHNDLFNDMHGRGYGRYGGRQRHEYSHMHTYEINMISVITALIGGVLTVALIYMLMANPSEGENRSTHRTARTPQSQSDARSRTKQESGAAESGTTVPHLWPSRETIRAQCNAHAPRLREYSDVYTRKRGFMVCCFLPATEPGDAQDGSARVHTNEWASREQWRAMEFMCDKFSNDRIIFAFIDAHRYPEWKTFLAAEFGTRTPLAFMLFSSGSKGSACFIDGDIDPNGGGAADADTTGGGGKDGGDGNHGRTTRKQFEAAVVRWIERTLDGQEKKVLFQGEIPVRQSH